jgi:competence protein ComEA
MNRLEPILADRSSEPPGQAEATRRAGVHERAPAPARGRLAALAARARGSVWLPVAGKALGIVLLMATLGGIGAASTLAEAGQLPIELGAMRTLVELEPKTEPKPGRAPEPKLVPLASASLEADAGVARSAALTADGKVILNLAGVEDLRHLPGIGPKRAEQIVALRDKLKRFRRFTDLLRVRGIGPKRLQKILPKLVLDPPPAAAADAGPPP